jgi:hypothetical protein
MRVEMVDQDQDGHAQGEGEDTGQGDAIGALGLLLL